MSKLIPGVNDLETLYPKIAAQWHPTLNGKLLPKQVAAHSNKVFFWVCDKGHIFDATADKRVNGENCPFCNNRRLLVGFNDLESTYPLIAEEWDYEKNDGSPKDYTFRSTSRVNWKCSHCGNEWTAAIRDRVDSKYQLCPKCTAVKRGEEKHRQALERRGGITDPLLLMEWDYEKNEKGPEDYTPKSNKIVYWICSKCGHHFPAKISNRTTRKSCACCSNKIVVAGINDLLTTHPQLAAEWHPTKNGELKPTEVSAGQAKRVWWICPEGHEYPATILHRSAGTNCPICNSGRQTSFAEQAVFYYIRKVFPDAINRYTGFFKKGMEIDIYIPSIKLGIEYDGEAWHKKDKLSREIKKYNICKQNGIRLLRVMEKPPENGILLTADESLSIGDGPLYEKKQLAKVIRFLIDEIDPETNKWTRRKPVFHSKVDIDLERDEAEIRRYMTKVNNSFAELYPELATQWHPTKNGQMTPDKVKPHSNIRVWWICPECGNEYPASVGHRVSGTGCPKCGIKRNAKLRMKKVVMIDPDSAEEIRMFESISDAAKEMKINPSNISTVCKGERKKAGGYIWKYREDN